MPDYKLVSFNLCPFVQRSVIALREKGVPYDVVYIDLADKPDWFLEISPFGKVPLLEVDGTVLFESAVINEFLEETTEPRLHPTDPLRRAHNRAWIEFGSALLVDGYKMQSAKDEASCRDHAEQARQKLAKLEKEVHGKYFNGDDFSLVDAAIAPALQRLQWSMDIAPSLALWESVPKVAAWKDALLDRPSVKKSIVPELQQIFVEYLKGRGSPTRKVEPTWLGTQA